MGLIKLTSSDAKFSYTIGKNPASGLLLKEIRNGVAFGFFPQGSTTSYVVWFRDQNTNPNQSSFAPKVADKTARKISGAKDGKSEVKQAMTFSKKGDYLNFSQYSSPTMYLNLLQEYFGSSWSAINTTPKEIKEIKSGEKSSKRNEKSRAKGGKKSGEKYGAKSGVEEDNKLVTEKNETKMETKAEYELFINSVRLNGAAKTIIQTLDRYWQNISVTFVSLAPSSAEGDEKVGCYSLKISNKPGCVTNIAEVFCATYLVLTFLCSIVEKSAEISQVASTVKAINCLSKVAVQHGTQGTHDYYLKYLLSSRVIHSKKIFDQVKPLLEAGTSAATKFYFGNSAGQRRNFIEKKFAFDRSILDMGCGEGFYVRKYAKLLKQRSPLSTYYAYDVDQSAVQHVKNLLVKFPEEYANVKVLSEEEFTSLSTTLDVLTKDVGTGADGKPGTIDILCTEVVEHMEITDTTKFLRELCTKLPIHRLVITTPNADFNKVFLDVDHHDHGHHKGAAAHHDHGHQEEKQEEKKEEKKEAGGQERSSGGSSPKAENTPPQGGVGEHSSPMRHHDHKWEYGGEQFKKYFQEKILSYLEIEGAKAGVKYDARYIQMGDSVDGISLTQGFILTRC